MTPRRTRLPQSSLTYPASLTIWKRPSRPTSHLLKPQRRSWMRISKGWLRERR